MRVNNAAIVVSAIVFWIFGAIWYDLLFKSAWMSAAGITPQTMTAAGRGAGIYAMVGSHFSMAGR
jgi:hypothetical protein